MNIHKHGIFHVCRAREGGRRRGFMGHLTKMANTLVSSLEKGENAEFVKDCFNGELYFDLFLVFLNIFVLFNFSP